MVATLVPTVEPSNNPPRVKIDIEWTGKTTANIYRVDPDGFERPVRLAEPATLSGGIAVLYDYESWFGRPFSYRAVSGLEEMTSASVTLTVNEVWLRHPGKPSLSMRIDVISDAEPVYGVTRAVFWPVGRESPIVYTDGKRRAKETTMTFRTWDLTERQQFLDIMADSAALLLDVPESFNWGIQHQYMACGPVTETRLVPEQGQVQYRSWTVPYNQVERPAGGQLSQWTFGQAVTEFASFTDSKNTFTTFANLLGNVRS